MCATLVLRMDVINLSFHSGLTFASRRIQCFLLMWDGMHFSIFTAPLEALLADIIMTAVSVSDSLFV